MKISLVNIIVRKISLAAFALSLVCAAFSFTIRAQVEGEPKIVVVPKIGKVKAKADGKTAIGGDTFAEKSIHVDAKVNISLCVAEGSVKVTGWERNEIRAFVAGGSKVNFKVQQKNRQTNIPVWVFVTALETNAAPQTRTEECLSGEEIELDVPRGATVTVKGQTAETRVESIRKAIVRNVGGDIFLNNIEQGISALTHEGDVMVENSGGAVTLEATNGNVVAFDVAPSEIGDIFKARTVSGAITLERVEHRQTEITSTSGSIKFNGEFQSGGQYSFGTMNGTIALTVPEKSSMKLNATYGLGKFSSELKFKIITENNTSRAQRIVASIGDGDCNVNLTTYSGAIRIKKQ